MIDTSGYLPSAVRASAETLVGSGLYCFVSSVSVYADFTRPNDEESPVAELGDLADDEVTGESYGALKALCEDAVRDVFGDRALVVRPGLIVGPHDPTGRFTYWPHRVARGGEVLAPGPSDRPTQFIDVRDLAEWMLDLCERGVGGTFNATHPGLEWGELLGACASVTASDARITWVTDEFLVEHEVGEWMELPLWVSALDPAAANFDRVDVRSCGRRGLDVPAPLGHRSRHARPRGDDRRRGSRARTRGRSARGVAWPPVRTTPARRSHRSSARSPGAASSSSSRRPARSSSGASTRSRRTLDPADGLWIAWPKKAAKIDGDLTFEAVQEIGLAHGLVDNKSCSIDDRWQALRFVYRLTDRPSILGPAVRGPRAPRPSGSCPGRCRVHRRDRT